MEKVDFTIPGMEENTYDVDTVHVALGKLRAEAFNDSVGDLKGYDCPKCKNRGVFAQAREDGSLNMIRCSCNTMRTYLRRLEVSGLRDALDRYTFDTYETLEPWQKTLKETVERYAKNPRGWLLIGGQSGCGKTHLCTAVCTELIKEGKDVVYMPWREEVEKMKDFRISGDAKAKLKGFFMNAPILYIDDLFKCGRAADGSYNPSGFDVGVAYDIINYRWAKQLPTIISTERSTDELVAIDEATGSRIAELAGDYRLYITKKPGRNYRLRNETNL